MRKYKYPSKARIETDFWMHEVRFLPYFIPDDLKKVLTIYEELYRIGKIDKAKITIIATYLKQKFNIDYRLIDDNHIIFLPRSSDALVNYFAKYPNLMSIIGDRHSGKTVTAWKIALDMLDRKRSAKLYVYGDVDALGYALLNENLIDPKRIVIKEDYRLPPLDGKPKIILYNELSEALMGKRALSMENIELNLQALRSRHLNAWIIYNVVRYGSLESVLRETTNIFLFKWMSGTILQNAMKNVPIGWRELLKTTVHYNQNEALAIVPTLGKGTTFFIHETNPPDWLLHAHKVAKKNQKLLMVKSEKERQIMEKIAELKMDEEKEWTNDEIRLIIQKEFGVNYSVRTIQNKWRKYRELMEIE